MTQKHINTQILITSILLICIIFIFEITDFDIFIQNFFYNQETSQWLLDKEEPLLRLFLYDGLKKVLIVFSIFILIILLFLEINL